jgi:hypothetical protein
MSNGALIHGSCLCGGVKWQAEGPLEGMSHCHCSMCRKSHGAPFGTTTAADARSFVWLGGEELIVRFRSSEQAERAFCGRCGSNVPDLVDGKAWMPAGCLDEDPGARPARHIFVASKAPWYAIPDDGLQRHDTYPADAGLAAYERPVEVASDPGWVRGSCLCAEVAYELAVGEWTLMQCHCSRCRKGRAAAHGGNFFAQDAQLRWLRGHDLLRTFKVPEAARFAQTFCSRCGSPQPRAAGPRWVVPAASLDADPGISAVRHIFVGSKAPWFEIRDTWPQYETMPPS